MSRDDPPEENEGAICVEFLDTQICVDDSGTISVYTGILEVEHENDDGFRVVATAPSIVGIGSYFDSFEDVERRLREWADENRDRIDACIRHAKEIASLSARVRHLEASLAAGQAALKVGPPAGPPPEIKSGGGTMSNDEKLRFKTISRYDLGWAQICPRTHDDRATLLAERIARSDYGDEWGDLAPRLKAVRIDIWSRLIEAIRGAGLELVEGEEGR